MVYAPETGRRLTLSDEKQSGPRCRHLHLILAHQRIISILSMEGDQMMWSKTLLLLS